MNLAEFTSLIAQSSEGCWIWPRAKDREGYGITFLEGRCVRAHRAAWTVYNGPIPDGQYVCHHCDNPSCVNPTHLFLGTALENMRDKTRKGRGRYPGPTNPIRKLNDAQLQAIAADSRPNRIVAKDYGVSHVAIFHARRRAKT